jgi:hypothetical protein
VVIWLSLAIQLLVSFFGHFGPYASLATLGHGIGMKNAESFLFTCEKAEHDSRWTKMPRAYE